MDTTHTAIHNGRKKKDEATLWSYCSSWYDEKKFKQTPLPDYIFEELLQSRVLVNPIEKRIAAYIIGVKSEAS